MKLQSINFLDYSDGTNRLKRRKIRSAGTISSPTANIMAKPVESYKNIRDEFTLKQAIMYGVGDKEIEKVVFEDRGFSPKNASGISNFVAIVYFKKNGFHPLQKRFVEVTLGDKDPRELESLCLEHNVPRERNTFNPAKQLLSDTFTTLGISLAPWILGYLVLQGSKYKEVKIDVRNKITANIKDRYTDIKGVIGTEDHTRQNLFGYSNEIYAALDGLNDYCAKIRDGEVLTADDKGASFIFTGPPGTGKTHLADIVAQDIVDSAKAGNRKVLSVDISQILEEYGRITGVLEAIKSGTGLRVSERDIANFLIEKAEREGAEILLLRADDAGVATGQTELIAMFMESVMKYLRDSIHSAQKDNRKASPKTLWQKAKSLISRGEEQTEPTSLQGLALVCSTNSSLVKARKENGSYSEQANLDRVGHVYVVGQMEIQTRFEYIKNVFKQDLGLGGDVEIPEDFAKMLAVLSSDGYSGEESGAVPRDYKSIARNLGAILKKHGNPHQLMTELGANFKEFLADNKASVQLSPDFDKFITNKVLSPLAADGKIAITRREDISTAKTILNQAWNAIV